MLQERERLQAMMTHLHLNKKKVKTPRLQTLHIFIYCVLGGREKTLGPERERLHKQNSGAGEQTPAKLAQADGVWAPDAESRLPPESRRSGRVPRAPPPRLWVPPPRGLRIEPAGSHQTQDHRQDPAVSPLRSVVSRL